MGKAANAPRIAENEAMAFGKMIRSSARKLNLVAELIREAAAERETIKFPRAKAAAFDDLL